MSPGKVMIIIINNNLTNSYWSIGSTMNVKEDRAQTREMGGMETQFQCG